MFIPFSHVSLFTRSHGQEKSLSYYDLLLTLEYYSTDTSPPSFSSISSTTPPPLYSPSMSNNNSPTWRRIPPCHCYDFLVCFWNGLNFFELFKLLFSLGIDHNPPCLLCSHDLCLFLFLMFHSSHDKMAKRSHVVL